MNLTLPPYNHNIRTQDGKTTIYDDLRQKFVALTPEEWVRQHFVHFLIDHRGFPQALLANEVELRIGQKHLRCDTVLYDRQLTPRAIIEYKKPSVKITQKVFDQISTYNLRLHVDYLIVSNGIQHFCCKMDYEKQQYVFLNDVPMFPEM